MRGHEQQLARKLKLTGQMDTISGLLSALRSDDLRVVDQALQVIVRIMVNKDRFGYTCMARVRRNLEIMLKKMLRTHAFLLVLEQQPSGLIQNVTC